MLKIMLAYCINAYLEPTCEPQPSLIWHFMSIQPPAEKSRSQPIDRTEEILDQIKAETNPDFI